mgnify:CR=1 FL=1
MLAYNIKFKLNGLISKRGPANALALARTGARNVEPNPLAMKNTIR